MTFAELLQKNKDAILRRWLDGVLAAYGEGCSAAFRRQKDPMANPVGHSLRVGTRGIFEVLLDGMDNDGMDNDGMDNEKISRCLHEVIKIRAVQQFSASGAVGFVFGLKEAVRAELGKMVEDRRFASELAELERRIDRIALAAFDIFVQCREQVCELRINEVKRRVSWVMDKMNKRDSDPESARIDLE